MEIKIDGNGRCTGGDRFTKAHINELEWTHPASLHTADGHYRVAIYWSLDRYRVYVYRRVQEPEKFVAGYTAWHPRTALKTGNRLLREFAKRDQ